MFRVAGPAAAVPSSRGGGCFAFQDRPLKSRHEFGGKTGHGAWSHPSGTLRFWGRFWGAPWGASR